MGNRSLHWKNPNVLCRYETAVSEYQAALRSYLTPDTPVEDTKERGEKSISASSSPVGSPKHTESGHKVSILGSGAGSEANGPNLVVGSFMVGQISECYQKLGDWHDVLDWQEKLQQYRAENSDGHLWKAFSTAMDINYIRCCCLLSQILTLALSGKVFRGKHLRVEVCCGLQKAVLKNHHVAFL